MSTGDLAKLKDGHAFENMPPEWHLADLHVPFDKLNEDSTTEAELAGGSQAMERIALVGPSGSGKSSVAHYVLERVLTGVAPIWVSVGYESDDTVREPKAFAQHLVDSITKELEAVDAISEDERRAAQAAISDDVPLSEWTVTSSASMHARWLVPFELGHDVEEVIRPGSYPRSASDVIDAVGSLAEAVKAHDLTPVLVIDDSDRWLRRPGAPDRSDIVGPFFGHVLRAMAPLSFAMVVAVHESYLTMPDFQQAEGILERRISIPHLRDSAQLRAIVDRRIEVTLGRQDAGLVTSDAVEQLFDYYRDASQLSLRTTMVKLHQALVEAVRAETDAVSSGFVESAVSG